MQKDVALVDGANFYLIELFTFFQYFFDFTTVKGHQIVKIRKKLLPSLHALTEFLQSSAVNYFKVQSKSN